MNLKYFNEFEYFEFLHKILSRKFQQRFLFFHNFWVIPAQKNRLLRAQISTGVIALSKYEFFYFPALRVRLIFLGWLRI